jgi:hypothetical protein
MIKFQNFLCCAINKKFQGIGHSILGEEDMTSVYDSSTVENTIGPGK